MAAKLYKIQRNVADRTFEVLLNNIELSNHQTLSGANEAIGRYKDADSRRAGLAAEHRARK